ncbi:hypothetical protein BGZ46_000722 [Entomortierella lignicola]|nr:hypothetical protein BGZ46_000722 [Entomortierella lignicola]
MNLHVKSFLAATLLVNSAFAQLSITNPALGTVWTVGSTATIGWTGECTSLGSSASAVSVLLLTGPSTALQIVQTLGTINCSDATTTQATISVPATLSSGTYTIEIETQPMVYSSQFQITAAKSTSIISSSTITYTSSVGTTTNTVTLTSQGGPNNTNPAVSTSGGSGGSKTSPGVIGGVCAGVVVVIVVVFVAVVRVRRTRRNIDSKDGKDESQVEEGQAMTSDKRQNEGQGEDYQVKGDPHVTELKGSQPQDFVQNGQVLFQQYNYNQPLNDASNVQPKAFTQNAPQDLQHSNKPSSNTQSIAQSQPQSITPNGPQGLPYNHNQPSSDTSQGLPYTYNQPLNGNLNGVQQQEQQNLPYTFQFSSHPRPNVVSVIGEDNNNRPRGPAVIWEPKPFVPGQ